MRARTATLAGSIVGGFLASVCCIVPLVFAVLGISGAAFALRFEPLRPYFLVLTYGLLAGAFYLTYRPAKAECGPGEACAVPTASRAAKAALWIVGIVVVLTTAFPLYSAYLF
jgi:mercuric ion transport protein